jgi:uncharacterized membrane protein YoaK (UPF0700 family)
MSEGSAKRILVRGTSLCLVAGYADAIGYTTLGGVFAANMTGNTVLFAIALGRGEVARAENYIFTLASFLVGAVFASILRRASGSAVAALLGAAALLAVAAFAGLAPLPSLSLIAMAMGLQGAAITRFGASGMQTVVVTATVIRIADHIVAHCLRESGDPGPDAARLDVFAWIAYAAGALLALLVEHIAGRPLVLAAAALFAVAVEVALAPRR